MAVGKKLLLSLTVLSFKLLYILSEWWQTYLKILAAFLTQYTMKMDWMEGSVNPVMDSAVFTTLGSGGQGHSSCHTRLRCIWSEYFL